MSQAFVFPGQGAQAPGMGRSLVDAYPAARVVFQEVDEALGQHLSRLMFEGPEDELTLTENAQPALLTASIAVVRVLEERFGTSITEQAPFLAGHSLGEYTALTAAGAIPLADTARLLRERGRAIQDAVPVGQGAMAAILGLPLDTVRDIAQAAATAEGQVCEVANDNAPTEIVVSGHLAAVQRACRLAGDQGAARTVVLPVSAPFHCSLLASAASRLEDALTRISIDVPAVPVVNNVTATPLDNPEAIRRRLIEQLTSMVRWRESVEFLRDQGVARLVELGPGGTLTRLAGRIDPALNARAIQEPKDVEDYMSELARAAEAGGAA